MKKIILFLCACLLLGLLVACGEESLPVGSVPPTENSSRESSSTVSSIESNEEADISCASKGSSCAEDSSHVKESEPEESSETSVRPQPEESQQEEKILTLHFNDIHGDHTPSYSSKEADVRYANYGDQTILFFVDWNQLSVIQKEDYNFGACGTEYNNEAWVLAYQKGTEFDTISCYHFTKEIGIPTKSSINLPTHIDEPKFFYSAVTNEIGYLAVFTINTKRSARQLTYLYKTNTGGETWELIEMNNAPHSPAISDTPILSRFVSEKVGFVSFRCYSLYEINEHVFYTIDGGETWISLSEQSLEYPNNYFCLEIVNLSFQDDMYIITARAEDAQGEYIYLHYSSSDLNIWHRLNQ